MSGGGDVVIDNAGTAGDAAIPVHERASEVKRWAAALRFDACGIAAAGNADPEDQLGDWLARGYHADMAWMARRKELRQDPREKLPGARSVVVVARNYFWPRPQAPAGSGRVSCYAWGRDYHRVLAKPLRALAQRIRSLEPGAQCYTCVDSGPVLEKFWAARAGIGWIGKNSLLLRYDAGSWFLLGVVLTTAEIEPDNPVPDQCGGCTRCIDACPTGAIVEPSVVDSRRCISYHTIENRGDVPREIQERMGPWVFGCDVCQEVCPWNDAAVPTSEPDFRPRPGHANPEVAALATMSEATFKKLFSGSPIMRAKHQGMQRNARIVLKNPPRVAGRT
jgi:epoxyqueuosine reductase